MRKTIGIIFIISFIFTSASLLARHFNFKTTAYDTGIQAGVARNLAFDGSFYNEVMNIDHRADHFAPALILPGLLFYVWDNAAVVFIFQNICIFLSILIAFYLAREILKNDREALLISFLYAVNYYLTAVNTTDFHIDILAVPLFLILLLLVEKRQTTTSMMFVGLISLVMLLIKEDIPLTLAGLGIFVLMFRKDRRTSGLIMLLIGGIGFYFVLNYFMLHPAGNEYAHINYYSGLGNSTGEVVKNILTRPDIVFKNLVTPTEKIFRPVLLLMSFMLLPIFAPIELASAAVPIFYQLVSSYRHQYMFHSHYAAPALPFLYYSSVYGFARAKGLLQKMGDAGWNRLRKMCLLAGAVLLFASTISTVAAYSRNIIRYDNTLYSTFKNKVKPLIPQTSRVISTDQLQPHFIGYAYSGRLKKSDDLASDPDYLVLYLHQRAVPWDESDYRSFIRESKSRYAVCYEDADFLVLRITYSAE